MFGAWHGPSELGFVHAQHVDRCRAREPPSLVDEEVADCGSSWLVQVGRLGDAVKRSVEKGQPWQILMSQTIFARLNAPKLQETVNKQKPWLRKLVCPQLQWMQYSLLLSDGMLKGPVICSRSPALMQRHVEQISLQ